jgi:DNA replication protein DnaC
VARRLSPPDAAHLFYQFVARRCERGSMLITSNRSVAEWGSVFGELNMAYCASR